mgnify:CR=1 FL=1
MRSDLHGGSLTLVAALIAGVSLAVSAGPVRAQNDARGVAGTEARDAWRASLEAEARGVWITSNAAYQAEDGGIERYGLDWSAEPGGMSGSGCLWGERSGQSTVFWRFARLWDPVEERGIVHQASPSGAVAMGYHDGGGEELIQTLVQPNGSRMEIRHLTELEGDSVRIDRSFQRADAAADWVEGRTYRWVRRMDVVSPCEAG